MYNYPAYLYTVDNADFWRHLGFFNDYDRSYSSSVAGDMDIRWLDYSTCPGEEYSSKMYYIFGSSNVVQTFNLSSGSASAGVSLTASNLKGVTSIKDAQTLVVCAASDNKVHSYSLDGSGNTATEIGNFLLPVGIGVNVITSCCYDVTTGNLLIAAGTSVFTITMAGNLLGSTNMSSVLPGMISMSITVDDAGNLLIAPQYSTISVTHSIVYKMNGVSSDILDVVDLGHMVRWIAWAGAAVVGSDITPVTGYPDVDSSVPVVDGVWVDPVTGHANHGAYVSEIIKVAKALGYTGSERARIISSAAKSDVNQTGVVPEASGSAELVSSRIFGCDAGYYMPTVYDYGEIPSNGTSDFYFTILNSSSAPVNITGYDVTPDTTYSGAITLTQGEFVSAFMLEAGQSGPPRGNDYDYPYSVKLLMDGSASGATGTVVSGTISVDTTELGTLEWGITFTTAAAGGG